MGAILAKPSSAAGEDRLSALPDDVLVQILRLLSTSDAVRTSLVSRRWRRVWELLPDLRVHFFPDPGSFRNALDGHQVRLRYLEVAGGAVDPLSLAIWLPAAAARVSGDFVLISEAPAVRDEEEEDAGDYVELPCFEDATTISIRLEHPVLAMPPAGVFARLTSLSLERVRFHGGASELGDALSSPRCPCLQELKLVDTRGLDGLTVRSQTLVKMELEDLLRGFSELTVEAPALEELCVVHSLVTEPAVVTISAPRLESLEWRYSAGDTESVQLGEMPCLRSLGTLAFFVYGQHDFVYNRTCVQFLQRFQVVETLKLMLSYLEEINNYHYLMEEINVIPDLRILHLMIDSNGHAFGAAVFHVLRMCIGIRKLVLQLSAASDSEVQTACPPGCICEQQSNWQTEEFLFVHLQEIEILKFRGSDHEVSFVKKLFDSVTQLIKVRVTFNVSVTQSKAKELIQMFQSFSTPGVRMDFRYYNNTKVLDAAEN